MRKLHISTHPHTWWLVWMDGGLTEVDGLLVLVHVGWQHGGHSGNDCLVFFSSPATASLLRWEG